ncbi:inositol monophosphatase family protein [Acetohalobium arabaticum]|uniref:Inositol-1-monophosphatase n=1 Tax=Acetohalobium arabaticum (strain ATCC 49924 / DSM 5501 / Z-7288) TaxID=574087 RepID=D9QQW8_ACEAZ|nr:inositol monophosphatase family protein [Acetohalobium arabaticum]ADL12909.1 inositol monophosphatase [Acetohalobium arabaticum DSM 5501]
MLDLKECAKQVKEWARGVGEFQLERLDSNFQVNCKSSDVDLVTEVDELSEEILIEKINNNYPDHSILAEESGVADNDSDYRWVIDPLDGTTNYAHGFSIFAVSIALEYKEEVVLGVVYIPPLDHLYWAVKGEGAFLNDEWIEISRTNNLGEALLATGFPYDKATARKNNLDNFTKLVPQIRGIRRSGSAAFDLCNVASGVFDAFWELKLSFWDIAAGALLVEEAGGEIVTFNKEKGITIVAGNDSLVEQILAEIGE